MIQSLIAVGTGGVTGVGLMEGRQKLFYLPYPYSDFVFAVIGEELGLLGALAVVIAFVVLLWRGLRAAWSAPDEFGRFLAAGLTLVDRAAGAHQHLGRARPAAAQGHPAAVHQRGRLLARVRALRRRPGRQRVAAWGLTWRARS